MFVHVPGRKLLLAASSGHGFVTNEDDAIAMTRAGKKVMNVKPGIEAMVARGVAGDQVAVVGENRKLLIFPLSEVPEMARGAGCLSAEIQGWRLIDATTFAWSDGLKDENGRQFGPSDLKGVARRTCPGRAHCAQWMGALPQIPPDLRRA